MLRDTALIVLALAGSASAEPTRSGLMFGASLGGGGTNGCRDCDASGGPFAELHIGAWLTPRFALSYEAWINTGNPQDIDHMTGQGFGLATATTRLAPRWWLKGGLGFAMYTRRSPITDPLIGMDTSIDHKGFGLGSGVGYELHQSPGSFVVDVSARLAAGLFPGHGAGVMTGLGIGVSWN